MDQVAHVSNLESCSSLLCSAAELPLALWCHMTNKILALANRGRSVGLDQEKV